MRGRAYRYVRRTLLQEAADGGDRDEFAAAQRVCQRCSLNPSQQQAGVYLCLARA
jgi:hypothetical protein